MGAARDLSLYVEAAGGSVAAHMSLMLMSRQGAASGALAVEEGLAVAELFGRFALNLGHRDALPPLISALLARCAFEQEQGSPERGCQAGAQAIRRLNHAADNGDEDAAAAISKISAQMPSAAIELAAAWQSPEWVAEFDRHDDLFRRGGGGDVDAIRDIAGIILSEMMSDGVSQLEGLALIESVARLGAVYDDTRCTQALAGVLLIRAAMAREARVPDSAHYSEVLALSLLSELAGRAHPRADEHLKAAIAEVSPRAVIETAKRCPLLLNILPCAGAC